MSLPSTPLKGSISFSSNIQDVYGGTNPINLSEYYFNSSSNYVIGTGGTNIPVIGPISISKFYGKTSLLSNPYEAMIDVVRYGLTYYYGNITSPNLDNTNNQFASIGTVGFDFYWFGINYGINNNIFWSTNNAITFGTGIAINTPWTATTAKGVLIGQANRYTIQIRQFPPEDDVFHSQLIYKHYIKQLYVEASDTAGNANPPIKMEISLIRGRIYQYIEIIVINWDIGGGIWNISDGSIFYNPFISSTNPPIGTNRSVVLRGSLNGTDWVAFNDYSMMKLGQNGPYVTFLALGISLLTFIFLNFDANAMTMGGNLGYINQGDKISLWYRSNNSANNNHATQSILSRQPIYNTCSVLFSDGNVLVSTLGLYNHIQVNIFVVWRKTASSSTKRWLWSHDVTDTATDTKRSLIINGDNSILVGRGGGTPLTVNYTFPLYITNVVNCEYNSAGNTGKFYINNVLRNTFINVDSTGTTEMSIGSFNNGTTINSSSSINGIIYEIFCTRNVLTDIDRTKIFKYLNVKWGPFYEDAITSMGEKLVFRLDGNNIDGAKNYFLNEGGAISSWYNSGNQAGLTTTQTVVAEKPTYNLKGGCIFNGEASLYSSIKLTDYPKMNIFVVWKNMNITQPLSSERYLWGYYQRSSRMSFMYPYPFKPTIKTGIGDGGTRTLYYDYIPYNTTFVVNCEYNLVGEQGGYYINNNKIDSFTSRTPSTTAGTTFGKMVFGASIEQSQQAIFYEIIVIKDILSNTERTKIYNLLNTRWGPFENFCPNALNILGSNLIFLLDGYNIDGRNNITLTPGSMIMSWCNLGYSPNISTNSIEPSIDSNYEIPRYNAGGGLIFDPSLGMSTERGLLLENKPLMNIFVVWKKTSTSSTLKWLWSDSLDWNLSTSYRKTLGIDGDTRISVWYGTASPLIIDYSFPLYTTTVVNCEYNSAGNTGSFYINNTRLGTFSSVAISGASYFYIGTRFSSGLQNTTINGIIYEFIIIDRLLSDTERTNIYNFLNVKWGPFYTDAITSMGDKLVLRMDGYNIDGNKNTTLTTSGSKISSWFNSGNTYSLTTSQSTLALQPTYNTNGVEFLNNSTTVLVSNINFNNYPIMNIFLVFKKTVNVPAGGENYLWASTDTTSVKSVWLSDNYLNIATGGTGGTTVTVEYTFPIGETFIVNCEYNTNSSKMYIDNILKKTFSVTNSSSADVLACFGNKSISAPIASTINGIFYEIIIINRDLLDTERKNIYNCLNNKWDTYFDPMVTSLILRHDGKNIDGTNNSTLTSGTSTISSWFNSGNVASLTTTQTNAAKRPTYTNNSAVFDTNNKGLNSTIVLSNYQIMNIIVVWSLTTMPDFNTGYGTYVLWSDEDARRILYISSNSILIGKGYSSPATILNISNTFTLNTTVIYNLEYNLEGQPGNFYINNILKTSSGFTTLIAANSSFTGTRKTYFGYLNDIYHLNGKIYEIIIINRLLKTTERTNIYNLLKTKWNVP